jgi:acyl-CoA synthetase (AMP-forming)/AMP-acid ligase II
VSGNGIGELCVKGPNVMKGYLNNPEATKNMIDADGFLHTGDVVQVDKIGDFYIVDRIKELIKYKGYQVPPAELEAILQTHEAVADAAVIPVISEELATELPRAYVALKETHKGAITASELAEYVAKRVAPHKQLRGGVEFLDAVPRSPSGKILRKLLRNQANNEKKILVKF